MVAGNCDARRTPARIGLMKSICGSSARFGCGLRMPIGMPSWPRTIHIASAGRSCSILPRRHRNGPCGHRGADTSRGSHRGLSPPSSPPAHRFDAGLAAQRGASSLHKQVSKEVTETDRHAGHGAQCAQIELPPHRLVRVVRARTDQRGKVVMSKTVFFRKQKLADLARIHPTVSGPAECKVVEVEAVDVDVGLNMNLPKWSSRPKGRLRARPPNRLGEMNSSVGRPPWTVKARRAPKVPQFENSKNEMCLNSGAARLTCLVQSMEYRNGPAVEN